MAKNRVIEKHQREAEEFNFSDMLDLHDDDVMVGIMSGLIEASRHQTEMAIQLTKIIVEKNSESFLKEEDILSTFQRASQTIALSSPIKELWEKMKM